MKIATHTALARQRRRRALLLSVGGTVILLAGLWFNFRGQFGAAFAMLFAGSIVSWFGIILGDKWIGLPRPDQALAEGLRDRTGRVFALYNWVLPADHVFLAPWGLTVFAVFNQDGPVRIDGLRWRDARPIWKRLLRLGRRPVVHPGALLAADIAALRAALAGVDAALADVPIEGVAVFTHPAVDLRVDGADMTVLRAFDLGEWSRAATRRPRIPDEKRRQVEAALDGLAEARKRGPTAGSD